MEADKGQEPYLIDSYYVNILPNIVHIICSYVTYKFLVRFLPGHSFNYRHVLFVVMKCFHLNATEVTL